MKNKKYTEVLEHLSALRSGSLWQLEFSYDLEERYQLGQNDWYRDAIRISSLLGIALLFASYIVELVSGTVPVWQTILARGFAMTGLLCAYIYICRSINLTWKYWIVSLNTVLVIGALLIMARLTPAPIKLIYYTNVFFVEVVVFTFIRLPLNFTSTLGLVMLLMVAGSLYLDSMNNQLTFHLMFFLITGTVLAIMVAIKTEKMSRESFLKSELIHFEKNHFRALNEQLNEQICLDRITHLLNRMSFEDRLVSAWNNANLNKQFISLVAINVEQFAYYNAQFGSEMGDDLLREVARRIRRVLDGSTAEVSRLNGGRFIILLSENNKSIENLLEKIRTKLVSLNALEGLPSIHQKVYLTWGRVNIEPESERDPRGIIDRMFNHLAPLKSESADWGTCRLMNKQLKNA